MPRQVIRNQRKSADPESCRSLSRHNPAFGIMKAVRPKVLSCHAAILRVKE